MLEYIDFGANAIRTKTFYSPFKDQTMKQNISLPRKIFVLATDEKFPF